MTSAATEILLADTMGSFPLLMGCVLFAWLFALGGSMGSFINVVVYRLPADMSLIRPGSHCPSCEAAIRWYDNVPIFGWLMLRGRCRDCGCKISARYPIVEALVAAMFVALAWVELFCDGANLPRQSIAVDHGVVYSGLTLSELLGIYFYHLFLLCTLLTAALIELDDKRVPPSLALPAVVVGLLAPPASAHLHPVPAFLGLDGWANTMATILAGLVVGLLLGLMLRPMVLKKQRAGTAAMATIVGIFLGWQAAAMLCVPLMALLLFQSLLQQLRPGKKFVPATAWLAVSAFVWILFWRDLIVVCF
ncbi:MAG: prepilin peptidase [Planctomycetota bacterium]|nr:prepilin peptidase [Planctomycetota bacterium]